MKTKSFYEYLTKRLNKNEIKEIERQALLEQHALETMRREIAAALKNYMCQEKIGFNELTRRLGASPSLVAKIRKGDMNLTMATIAHIFALLGKKPHIIFA